MKLVLVLAALAGLVPAAAHACPGCNMDKAAGHADAKAAPAKATAVATAPAAPASPGDARVTIPVSGMHCDHCISRVKTALEKVDGVKSVEATLEPGQATVAYQKDKVKPSQLVEAIDGLGFKAGKPSPN